MTLPDSTPEPPPLSLASLHQSYLQLRLMFLAVLIIVLVLSGSVNIFLLRQVSLVRREIQNHQIFLDEYTRTTVPLLTNFVARLQEFSRSHPDFVPILTKYGIPAQDVPAPGTPSARPLPPAK